VTRYIGRCGVCEGDYKLLSGRLVHHGYRRPGHGYIVGDCFGVARLPYPATDALIEYRGSSSVTTQEPILDPARRFYVSVRDGERWGLLLGPFTLHQEALDRVDAVREACSKAGPRAHWYGFGTASLPAEDAATRPGRLNGDPRLVHLAPVTSSTLR
jgi:hypothetical protein